MFFEQNKFTNLEAFPPYVIPNSGKYKETGLEFLTDKPRPGRPTVIDGLARAKITALACSDAPEGYERWSLRLLADKAVELELVEAISYMEVSRILKKTNCSLIESATGVSAK